MSDPIRDVLGCSELSHHQPASQPGGAGESLRRKYVLRGARSAGRGGDFTAYFGIAGQCVPSMAHSFWPFAKYKLTRGGWGGRGWGEGYRALPDNGCRWAYPDHGLDSSFLATSCSIIRLKGCALLAP